MSVTFLADVQPWQHQWQGFSTVELHWIALLWLAVLVMLGIALAARWHDQRNEEHSRAEEGQPADEAGQPADDTSIATPASLSTAEATTGAALEPVALAGPPMLASDAEREEVAHVVAQAMGEGRLSIDEGVERIDAAFRARHRHQLAALREDLPIVLAAHRRSRGHRGLGALAAVAVAAAVAVQALAGVWELWPVALMALAPLAFRRRG